MSTSGTDNEAQLQSVRAHGSGHHGWALWTRQTLAILQLELVKLEAVEIGHPAVARRELDPALVGIHQLEFRRDQLFEIGFIAIEEGLAPSRLERLDRGGGVGAGWGGEGDGGGGGDENGTAHGCSPLLNCPHSMDAPPRLLLSPGGPPDD